jgi:chromosome segregation ATPase
MRVSRKARTQTQTKKGRLQTMARRSNKTPQEIAAELQRQADAAKARAALAEVSDNPILAPLQKELDTINRNIAGYSRKISGPQSFANRIEAARLRMAWIEAEQDSVTAANKIANAQREYLQQQINSVAQDIANGDAPDAAEVSQIIDNMPKDANLPALMSATEEADAAWRQFAKDAKSGTTNRDDAEEGEAD